MSLPSYIGRYAVRHEIARGGFATVVFAWDEELDSAVAIKILNASRGDRDAELQARFIKEARLLRRIRSHHVVSVHDVGRLNDGRAYFVMDLVKGVPITEYCDQQHLPVRARLELMATVCHAVQHAHQKGIIHRDLKPTNVLVAEYDNHAIPKVIDFGVAKAIAKKLTEHTNFTEFGQVVPDNGSYILDNLHFTPEVNRDYLQGALNYFLTATDAALGYPADGNRLVQFWAWYSLYDPTYGGSLRTGQGNLTLAGQALASAAASAWTPYADLYPAPVVTPAIPNGSVDPVSVTLTVRLDNLGNTASGSPSAI